MKKLIIVPALLFCLVFTGFAAHSQEKTRPVVPPAGQETPAPAIPAEPAQPAAAAPAVAAPNGRYKEGVAMLNGQMVELRQGQQLPLDHTFRATDGTQVSPDGVVKHPNGVTKQLREGKAVNLQGRIVNYRDDMFTPAVIRQHGQERGLQTETIIIKRNDSTQLIEPKLQHFPQEPDKP